MPTYQYRCTECGTDLEVVQKFTDPALTECPECEGRLRKVFSAVGVVFKGSGFYATDNRTQGSAAASRSGEQKAAKSEGTKSDGTKADGSGSSAKKTDAKAAGTGDSKPTPVSAA